MQRADLRELHHSARAQCGNGWLRAALPDEVWQPLRSILLPLTDSTLTKSAAWVAHNREGEQASDAPMLQLKRNILKTRELHQVVSAVQVAAGEISCPCCHFPIHRHHLKNADVNAIGPGAALWPHVDEVVEGGACALLLLVRAAVQGGDLRVETSGNVEEVAWQTCGEDASRVKYRMRDTESTGLFREGEYVVVHGEKHLHEVTRVAGNVVRVSLAMTLVCPRME
jgi:hypothetical protein